MEPRLTAIRAITRFIFVEDSPSAADLIIVPGSSHTQLPYMAVRLFKKGFCNKIVFTGGFNPKIGKNECDFGKELALKLGVPVINIICENISSNTKENAVESINIARKHHLSYKTILLVCKPYHARRLEMTFAGIFPKSRLLMIPVRDERDITRNNWWKDKEKTAKVLEEVGKISEYFLKGDLVLGRIRS